MIRLFMLTIFSFLLMGAINVEKKIEKNQTLLDQRKQEKEELNEKIEHLGAKIVTEEKELDTLKSEIHELTGTLEEAKEEYEAKSEELKLLKGSQKNLIQTRKNVEQDMINILTRELSFFFAVNGLKMNSVDDMISQEVFDSLSQISKKNIENLQESHKKLSDQIAKLSSDIINIQRFTTEVESKRNRLSQAKKKQTEILASLKDKKSRYSKRLTRILQEQEELLTLLADLKIIQKKESARAKAKAEAKEREKERLASAPTIKPKISDEKLDVRQIGSSYHNVKTVRYRGKKTIPPLDSFEVAQKFGPYFDPVYKMKVFNESITLKPSSLGAKVKSVLGGKVVFAKETPMLQKVVIVEHPGNLHTIYAHLDKIAPTIKAGRKIKKGYTIGRVQETLMFEVTQKNLHIDPLELINI